MNEFFNPFIFSKNNGFSSDVLLPSGPFARETEIKKQKISDDRVFVPFGAAGGLDTRAP